MQLSSDAQIPDGLLAANVLLREKPHQGVPSWNLAPHQGIDERNSTAAIGLRVGQHLNRVWPRYTGKERDTESGNDYFGARYYASSMGRFMSPDWSAKEEPAPYANLDDPQSLNLYSYVKNNPLSKTDPDGHCPECIVEDFEALSQWVDSGAAEADVHMAMAAGGMLLTTLGAEIHGIQSPSAAPGGYPTTFNSDATDRGRANEGTGLAEVGATKNTTPSTTTDPKTGKEVTTIPDGKMTDGQHVEVKDTNVVRSTPQIRAQGQASVAESGKKPILVTGKHTKVSKSVDAAKGGTHIVVRTPKLGPQQ